MHTRHEHAYAAAKHSASPQQLSASADEELIADLRACCDKHPDNCGPWFLRSQCEAISHYIALLRAAELRAAEPLKAASVQWWPKSMRAEVLQWLLVDFRGFETDLPMITEPWPTGDIWLGGLVTAHLPPALRDMYSVDVLCNSRLSGPP